MAGPDFCPNEINLLRTSYSKVLLEARFISALHRINLDVICFKEGRSPFSVEEKAWWKYLKRVELEKEHPERFKVQYSLDEDTFYHRDDVGKLRGKMMGTIHSTHSQGAQILKFGKHTKD